MTTGARAIVAAKAARISGRGSQQDAAKSADLHFSRVTEANLILDWAPHLADAVLAGATPLSRAVEEARELKREAEDLKKKTAYRPALGQS